MLRSYGSGCLRFTIIISTERVGFVATDYLCTYQITNYQNMTAEFFKIIAIYLLTLVTLSGLTKFALSFWKKHISFGYTLKRLVVAALAGNVLSFILFEATKESGYYWGEIPTKLYIIQALVLFLPIVFILIALMVSIKKQLFNASRQPVEAP
ncbi:hypothetical protein [Paradesertivirga mongoliensis]|uniref:hypothetical protein n=1 Tax=Paradesertivirga mongoliensis TaxID=2100740 RepID=UPI0036D3F480